MKRPLFVILGLALTACGTPQENCIRRETRDLRVVEDLIVETQGNLQRGYALENVTKTRAQWEQCFKRIPGAKPGDPPRVVSDLCFEREQYTVKEPRAIDLNAEARKLDSLNTRRGQLLRQVDSITAQCRALYPE